MTGVMGKFLVTGIVLSTIVACSGGDSNNNTRVVPKAKVSSCEFNFTDGGQADYSALGTSRITRTYFEKEYNQNYLNAVSASNVDTTMDFVNMTGATVYKSKPMDNDKCKLSLFQSAKPMTSDIKNRWDDANGTITGTSVILGLYLPKTASTTYPSLNAGAAIVVRENTDRWTLVHEFMHHLFMLRASEQGYEQDSSRSDIEAAANEVDAILGDKTLTDSQKVVKATPAFVRFANGMDSLMVHFSLEEITIEATLKDASNAGSLQYVPTDDDNWYIYTSAKKALGVFENVEDNTNQFLAALPAANVAEQLQLKNILTTIAKRKATIAELRARFPYSASLQGGVLLAGKHSHNTGCSHEAEGQKVVDLGNRVKVNFKKAN